MSRKIVVWDLFGGSQNSVYNALDKDKYKVYTFDINEDIQHIGQYIVDLTDMEGFEKLLLGQRIKKPDIIVASPLCTTFSWILHVGSEETFAWKLKDNKYEIRDEQSMQELKQKGGFFRHLNIPAMIEKAKVGKTLLENSLKIIEKHQPKYWYIENPQYSIMWKYIKRNCDWFKQTHHHNVAHYNSYDLTFTQKPTIFMSNKRLDLRKDGIRGNINKPQSSCRSNVYFNGKKKANEQGDNVKIPKELIKDIFTKFTGENNE